MTYKEAKRIVRGIKERKREQKKLAKELAKKGIVLNIKKDPKLAAIELKAINNLDMFNIGLVRKDLIIV